MSVRVLETEPGEPCNHGFMDDLESFFWLILWSVSAHLEPDQSPTVAAQKTINMLEQADLDQILFGKMALFNECADDGTEIKRRLLKFQHPWACNDRVPSLIHSMGKYFNKARLRDNSPTDAFPTVVDMLYKALYRDLSE